MRESLPRRSKPHSLCHSFISLSRFSPTASTISPSRDFPRFPISPPDPELSDADRCACLCAMPMAGAARAAHRRRAGPGARGGLCLYHRQGLHLFIRHTEITVSLRLIEVNHTTGPAYLTRSRQPVRYTSSVLYLFLPLQGPLRLRNPTAAQRLINLGSPRLHRLRPRPIHVASLQHVASLHARSQ